MEVATRGRRILLEARRHLLSGAHHGCRPQSRVVLGADRPGPAKRPDRAVRDLHVVVLPPRVVEGVAHLRPGRVRDERGQVDRDGEIVGIAAGIHRALACQLDDTGELGR